MPISIPLIAAGGAKSTVSLPDPTVSPGGTLHTYNLFAANELPYVTIENDAESVELGVRFTPDVDGVIAGIKFFKGDATNTAPHVCTLWSNTGTVLAQATTANETSSGWQQVLFATPIQVSAGASYVASYHCPGHYSADNGFFTAVRDTGALKTGVGAGVFKYGTASAFPSEYWNNSNYWVDVVFQTAAVVVPPPPVTPPGLPALWNATPPAGVCGAPVGTPYGFRDYDGSLAPVATNEIWDNFNGPAGSKPDDRLWWLSLTSQGGAQLYDLNNVFLDGGGHCVLRATQDANGTVRSGRFTGCGRFNMEYGWLAARIKFPYSGGTKGRSWFPAFWTLQPGWNTQPYGETDIMEFFGDSSGYSTTIYFPNTPESYMLQNQPKVPSTQSGGNAGNDFHTYWMMWTPDYITIGVDDFITLSVKPAELPDPAMWAGMTQPHYFIVNFAVHPGYLPAPLPSDFPCDMLIDWIWFKPLSLL